MISSTELELKLTEAKPGSPEYTEIEGRLEGLQKLQGAAANQVTLAEAYQEYGVAQTDAADLAVTVEPLKQHCSRRRSKEIRIISIGKAIPMDMVTYRQNKIAGHSRGERSALCRHRL